MPFNVLSMQHVLLLIMQSFITGLNATAPSVAMPTNITADSGKHNSLVGLLNLKAFQIGM